MFNSFLQRRTISFYRPSFQKRFIGPYFTFDDITLAADTRREDVMPGAEGEQQGHFLPGLMFGGRIQRTLGRCPGVWISPMLQQQSA
jgi:hypothetical protein